MITPQQRFEDRILFEHELVSFSNKTGYFDMDEITSEYKVLDDVFENNDDDEFGNRKDLITYINYKFGLLSDIQKKIAHYIFSDRLTITETAVLVERSTTTVHYHIQRIKELW